MNTRNLLVSVLILACVILSACGPAATATTVPPTSVPATEAPDEFALAGDPIPDNLLNVDYFLVEGEPPARSCTPQRARTPSER